ncbi:MAG TPA: hypothetical protein VIU12_01210 [Chryseolinea sp.]
MDKKILLTLLLGAAVTFGMAQQKGDTVIVELGKTSRVIFTVKDRKDLDILKHYDFQQLFQDILVKIENSDSTSLAKKDSANTNAVATTEPASENWSSHSSSSNDDNDDDDDDDHNWRVHERGWGRTWQSFNFDLGTNNYVHNGRFPDSDNALYSVRPWGSWYVALSSIQRTRLGRKFFMEWGMGVSWYNFKFQQDNVLIQKDDIGVHFVEDPRELNFTKSKLTASYIMASLVPIIDFGDHSRKSRIWEGYDNSFRIGLGPYVGYRIGSHSKQVYHDDGKQKDKNHDSFYLNSVRYGARLQIGYRATDLFINYDLNELFTAGKGPALNAFSFGVIF